MRLSSVTSLLSALADETRLRVVHALFRGQPRRFSVSELVEILGLPQPTVSRHLAILREAGLVQRVSEGTFRYYELADTQPRLHAAVLGALEAFVAGSPAAREDAERLDRIHGDAERLTVSASHATKRLLVEDEAMSAVFKALSHPIRRRLLDVVGRAPGATLSEVAASFEESRVAISKHLAVLERAGLVHSRRSGRERRLYADPMPVQLAYDRWTDRFSAAMAARMADIKYAAEGAR